MNSIKKLLIVGWGRSGKDAAGEYLGRISTLRYAGSTSWAAKEDVADALGVHPQVAWETRHENREKWKQICDHLRREDQTRLIRRALGTGEIVTGVRDLEELRAARHEQIFDRIIWVNRPGTRPDMTVTFSNWDCDEVIDNDWDILRFHRRLWAWAEEHDILRPVPASPTSDVLRE